MVLVSRTLIVYRERSPSYTAGQTWLTLDTPIGERLGKHSLPLTECVSEGSDYEVGERGLHPVLHMNSVVGLSGDTETKRAASTALTFGLTLRIPDSKYVHTGRAETG